MSAEIIEAIDDLTMFDYKMPNDFRAALFWPRLVYLFIVAANLAIDGLMLVSLAYYFALESVIASSLSLFFIVFGMAYVVYPRSKLARSWLTRIVLI